MEEKRAFTLVELLVIATIIGILSVAGVVSFSKFGNNSRDTRRKADVEQVRSALEMYKSNNAGSSYPTAAEGLNILVTDKYLKTIPLDPKSDADYPLTYTALPSGCDGSATPCTSYTINKTLESGEAYESDPYGSTAVTPTP